MGALLSGGGFWCRGDRRDDGRGGDWEFCNPLWWKGAAAEMNLESFWFEMFVCYVPPPVRFFRDYLENSDRLASDIDTWHAPMPPPFFLYNAFFYIYFITVILQLLVAVSSFMQVSFMWI